MITLPGYEILSLAYQDSRQLIFRAKEEKSQGSVLLKTQATDHPSLKDLADFRNEYHILQGLSLTEVLKALDLVKHQNRLFLILEGTKDKTLREWLGHRPIHLKDFFPIALSLTRALFKLHQKGIIHKDIRPDTILIDPITFTIRLFDFKLSSQLSFEEAPHLLEGSLFYMAPEQTGRMNRLVDFRCDFYSLGVTFYEMLTGHVPFDCKDPLELVFCHLAKSPPPLADISPMLAALTVKLMSKDAEDRYASALGIEADLKECQRRWQQGREAADFVLGEHDVRSHFLLSQKLYGREEPIEQLLLAFQRVLTSEQNELVLSFGPPGIGKSAFLQEVYKPLSGQKGLFIKGKFDLIQRSISYFGWAQALRELVTELLAEQEENLLVIKRQILEAVGASGRIITDLVSEFALIIGEQPPLGDLPPKEAKDRFHFIFSRFLSIFAKKDQPLVIFLDDLQWADRASLDLMEHVLHQNNSLLILGSFRDTEVDLNHPLTLTLQTLEDKITRILLRPLEEKDVELMLQESFSQASLQELAHLVFQKTAGNPFFVREFLKTIYQEKLLVFEGGQWRWSASAIEQKGITANVVELMRSKIEKLIPESQKTLALAACMGGRFDLSTLSIISQTDEERARNFLWPAIEAGLILPVGTSYKEAGLTDGHMIEFFFLHDKIQEAAYQLIPIDERQKVHLNIGRLLLGKDERLFDLLGHFNQALSLIDNLEEKEVLVRLNLLAGQKALASTAFQAALDYFQSAISLVPQDVWKKDYPMAFLLHKERAKCEALVERFDEAKNHLFAILDEAASKLDQAEVYYLLVSQMTMMGKLEEAIDFGLKGLAILGYVLPRYPTQWDLISSFLATKWRFSRLGWDKLCALSLMEDPLAIKAAELLFIMGAPAYFRDKKLLALLSFLSLKLTLSYGLAKGSIMGLILYVTILQVQLHDFKAAKLLDEILPLWSEKIGHMDQVVYYHFSTDSYHWYKPLAALISDNQRALQLSQEEGDLLFLTYANIGSLAIHQLIGEPLAHVLQLCAACQKTTRKGDGLYECYEFFDYIYSSLTESRPLEDGKINSLFHAIQKGPTGVSLRLACLNLSFILYILEDFKKAYEFSCQGMLFREFILGHVLHPWGDFCHALIMLKQDSFSKREFRQLLRSLRLYAHQCPENYLHFYLLVLAEAEALKRHKERAAKLFDKAIEHAQSQGFIQYVALANECAARFYLQSGQEKLAYVYLKEAHYFYTLWGAHLKTHMMEQQYPFLARREQKGGFDLLSVLKASSTISSEIVLNKLLVKMMDIVMENAGSQKGFLILEKEGKLWIEAESVLGHPCLLKEELLKERSDLAHSLILYVHRTKESVVLSNAEMSSFAKDPYIIQCKPKSILCSPILYQGRVMAFLYLENNATEGAFTHERVEVLNLLSSQAAISLENALLYEAMGRFVPVQFLQLLNKRSLVDVRLGDQIERNMSVLFCDIRGFTRLSETMAPVETFAFINHFLSYMEPCIKRRNGFIDKYIGDAVMALFHGEAQEALDAAIEMLKRLEQFNLQREGEEQISVGIGINSGELILGILGGIERLEGSVIGDCVNVAARLENLTKTYDTPLLISEDTKAALRNPTLYTLRLIGDVPVKGRTKSVPVWEVCDADPEPMLQLKRQTLDLFSQARVCLEKQDYIQAEALFAACWKANPQDKMVTYYLKLCSRFNIVS